MEHQQGIHHSVREAIRAHQQGGNERRQQHHHTLIILQAYNVDLQSVQYLADFLNGNAHEVTQLDLDSFSLLQPSDGGLSVLCDLFANNTTLTKVGLYSCNFGGEEETSQFMTACRTNTLVTDLTIYSVRNLEGAAYGNCISCLLQDNTTLQRLELGYINVETVRSFQQALRANRHLKILELSYCCLDDGGFHLIVDALVGNTTIEVLDISNNGRLWSDGLADLARLVKLSLMKTINAEHNFGLFDDKDAWKNFISVMRQHTTLEELIGLYSHYEYPQHEEEVKEVDIILARNRVLKRANALLSPRQPRTGLPICSKSGIWCKAMATMGRSHRADRDEDSDDNDSGSDDDDDNNEDSDNGIDTAPIYYPGASAIF